MAERTTNTRRTVNGILSFIALAAIIALFFEYRHHVSIKHPPRFSVSLRHLPYYAFCSFYRMLIAYFISLIFSIVYGLAATRGRLWERVLIPAIDIAQSVPVVGFFPAAVFFFVAIGAWQPPRRRDGRDLPDLHQPGVEHGARRVRGGSHYPQ